MKFDIHITCANRTRLVQTVANEEQAKRIVYARNRAEKQACAAFGCGTPAEWSYSASSKFDAIAEQEAPAPFRTCKPKPDLDLWELRAGSSIEKSVGG